MFFVFIDKSSRFYFDLETPIQPNPTLRKFYQNNPAKNTVARQIGKTIRLGICLHIFFR
jgi:hypothetical protein